MKLLEGGNVFKDKDGNALTQRINQTDVVNTVKWIERLTGLDFPKERWLGSTGRKPTSGDLDLAVDLNDITKEELANRLMQWVRSNGEDPVQWVKKAGEVHLRTPINGDPNQGFVQTDFMFFPNLGWGTFFYGGAEDSEYKGMLRNILLSSIAKSLNLKVGANGMFSRDTNQLVDGGQDPDHVAQTLIGPGATAANLKNVETIYAALAQDPNRDAKLKDFREFIAREGFSEPRIMQEHEVSWLARLRDRIVNQGYQVIVEAEARIPHVEDMVFDAGSKGAKQALNILSQGADDTAATTTVKWDGKPAVIFGRKPTGEFVLTDKSGFLARGYDGLATSPDMIRDMMLRRAGERNELVQMYYRLWPYLEAATPRGFRGFVNGDLLYTEQPQEVAGAWVFQPNTIEYRIPLQSPLGQRIANTNVGVAVHTYYEDKDSAAQPFDDRALNHNVPGLLLVGPSVKDIKSVQLDRQLLQKIKQLLAQQGSNIDKLFNPVELRANQLTDLPALCKKYINSRITSDFSNLLADFGTWLQNNVTPRKYNNIIEYLNSPSSNAQGMSAAFTVFLLLHELKMDTLKQLDMQQPGQEGWVMATQAGRAKLVNRFAFSAANRARNNPPAG